jgi:hypothetical protein
MPYKLFLIALFYPILGISQFAYDYQPLQSDKSLIYPILYEIEQKKIEDLEKTPRENRSYLKESYLYRIDRLIVIIWQPAIEIVFQRQVLDFEKG